MIIDQILVCCLHEESQRSKQEPALPELHETSDLPCDAGSAPSILQATDTDKDSSNMPQCTSDADTEQEEPAALELLHETPLSRIVTHNGETKRLSGFADYSVWYDPRKKGNDKMATNLLIVKAKRQYYTDAALPQLASYMGIVHVSRKDESKENCIVYGPASDGKSFRFCRIDNDGVFTHSELLDWKFRADRTYAIVRPLLRAAALSSPSTTPIKDPMHRKIVRVIR